MSTAEALGPPAAPSRKAMFELPPPEDGGLRDAVEIRRVVVERTVFPARPAARKTLGLSTMAWVTWGISVLAVRKFDGAPRLLSGNATGLCGGVMTNGVMLTGAKVGAPGVTTAVPCATSDVPCGMFARRATDCGS